MALTPESMTGPVNPEGGTPFDEPLVDGAPQHWALYPETNGYPLIPNLQVLPAGMWPWESPVSKAVRMAKGENPTEPPHDYNQIVAEALGFPFAEHPATGLPVHETTTVRVTARHRTTTHPAPPPPSPAPAATQL
jgi:hypothetical protein